DAVPDGGSESSASTSDRISLDEDGYYDELFEDLSLLKTIRAPAVLCPAVLERGAARSQRSSDAGECERVGESEGVRRPGERPR
ncbi:hypothetical protein, partial [Halorubrum sp. ASP1]|uniref:hypothetical protein n=1 Tax=Halorubrum sp. ASP1 TaxID=2518114 RepID=UPI001F545E58